MKYNKTVVTSLVCGMLLTGCGSTTSQKPVVKDGQDLVASLKDKDFFADDIYSSLTSGVSGDSLYFEAVLASLIDHVNPVDDAMTLDADTTIKQVEDSFKMNYQGDAEVQLNYALASQGFKSLDDYRNSLIDNLQTSSFLYQYVEENFDEIFKDYMDVAAPRMISIIKVSAADVEKLTDEEKEDLDEVTKLVDSSKDFGEIAVDYSKDSSATNKGQLGLIDNTAVSSLTSAFGKDVATSIVTLKEGEVSKAIKGEGGYFFVKCTSTNEDVIKKEVKNLGIDSPLLSYDQYLIYLIVNSYELSYEDDATKERVTSFIQEQIDARNDARKGDE